MAKYLGIDLGGTNIKYGVVDGADLIFRNEIPTEREHGAQHLIDKLTSIVQEMKDRFQIQAAGIGVPGPVDKSMKTVIELKNFFLKNVPIGQLIEEKTGVVTYLDNDANVAAVAEAELGHLKGVAHGILLTLGTGVGGGVIVDGKLHRGAHGLGFEVGHVVIGSEGYLCNCGRKDCFETYSSATGLVRYYNGLGNEEVKGTREIFERFAAGEPRAKEAVAWYTHYLGIGIVNLINIFDPSVIVLAGGVAKAFPQFESALDEVIKGELFTTDLDTAHIKPSHLGNDSGIFGSALTAKRQEDV